MGEVSAPLSLSPLLSFFFLSLKVALAKATKHKANPATDEVRVENRNHGLA